MSLDKGRTELLQQHNTEEVQVDDTGNLYGQRSNLRGDMCELQVIIKRQKSYFNIFFFQESNMLEKLRIL